MAIILTYIPEYDLPNHQQREIAQLLALCFPDYPEERSFTKQLPSFRLLAHNEEKQLVGHIAVEHRLINIDGQSFVIFGLADICVEPNYRQQKIATKMIKELEEKGRKQSISFLILLAWDPDFYRLMGFVEVNNSCRWLIIQRDHSIGLAQRKINSGLMIKALGAYSWPNGNLDFLGYIF